MAKENRLGPFVLPWDDNKPGEVLVYLVAGIVGAVISATLLYHYRRMR